jgi:hypothetical protein
MGLLLGYLASVLCPQISIPETTPPLGKTAPDSIEGVVIVGAQPMQTFKTQIDRLLAQAGASH